ncbi:MAG: ATP-binding protein [Candidatus Pacebacteria bacterium]|nr:ATP-binding protein [Candidatus Paceibacterota bacterium]
MRIAVIGPQNTGKSTFIKDFLKEFPHYTTPKETYRDVIERKELHVNQESTLASQKEIRDFMFGQLRHNAEYNVIFDRCMVDNYVYSYVQYEKGELPKWLVDETEAMMKDLLQCVDLYLFIPTAVSVPLVDDGTRDITASYIDTVNHHFLRILFEIARTHHITVKVISGSRQERIEQVKRLI